MKGVDEVKKTSARPADEIEKTVNLYADMLFRLSLLILGNSADAEDAVQETMLKYLQKSPDFKSEEHRKAWLITVTRNQCRDKLRLNKNHPTVDIDEFVGGAKAGQDLVITGNWECAVN